MKKNRKTTLLVIMGLLLAIGGIASILIFADRENEGVPYVEGDASTDVNDNIEVNEEPEEIDEENFRIAYVSLHPAGVGHVAWYADSIEDVGLTNFTISPNDEVEFDDHVSNVFPDNEDNIKEMESAIIAKSEEDKRAIYFLEGTMNEELNEGIMNWNSQRQFSGEVRFSVEENGDIIVNESDWNALPETDEKTVDDFYYTVEQMIHNWGQYYKNN